MTQTNAYAARAEGEPLAPFELQRRALRDDDVAIDIDYCGG